MEDLPKSLNYRPEIDGLRAFAVLPVILYHAGLGWLPGGFLGVDVFFVISGYLITGIIARELVSNSFSVVKFYERRARRILPALYVVMAFTLLFAYAWMPPDALSNYFRSLAATALFVSNFHFWQSNGYFRPDSDEQPLLHTWSLAVEEQFYVLFPLFLMLLWRFRKNLASIVAVVAVLGFGLCVWQVNANQDIAFYLIHARAWELLAGATLALFQVQKRVETNFSATMRSNLANIGGLLVVASFVVIGEQWLTPGVPTLAVVVGTVLLLAFAETPSLAHRVLTWRPIVAVGLISYSAYLWHHPLFAFARLRSSNEPALSFMLFLAAISLVLAYLSWRFIERPFRRQGAFSRRFIFAMSASILAVFGVAGLAANKFEFATVGYTSEQLALVQPSLSKADTCDWLKPIPEFAEIEICNMGKANSGPALLLWGDSHAAALFASFHDELQEAGRSGMYLKSIHCLRIPGIAATGRRDAMDEENCATTREALYAYLETNKPAAIVVSMRWTLRLFPVSGAGKSVGFDNGEGGVESEDHRLNWAKDESGRWSIEDGAKRKAVVDFLERLSKIAPLIVIGPVPEVGWHIGNSNFKSLFVKHEDIQDISTDPTRYAERNAVALQALDEAQIKARFIRIDPADIFCNTMIKARCAAQSGGTPYYSDDDHLSSAGAALIVREVMARLAAPVTAQP